MCRQGSIWKPSGVCWPGNLSPQHKYRPKPFGRYFLRKKPSPGRGWQGEALTGVGRYEPGPGTAPHPALGGVPFIQGYCGRQVVSPHPSRALPVPPSPWGKASSGGGQNPLLGEGGSAKPRRVWGGTNLDLTPPLFRPLRGHLPPGEGWRDFLRKTSKFMLTFWVFNGKIPEPHQEGLQVLPKSSRLESETTH